MAYSQIYDFDKYLAADDTTVPVDDEFMRPLNPHIDDNTQMPDKYIFQHSAMEASGKAVESGISQMLRITPGILPPVDKFPKSSKPSKPTKLPDFIPADERNKIPILLSEKYFKLQHADDDESKSNNKTIRELMNDLGGGDSFSGTSTSNKKVIGRNSRTIVARAKGIDSSGSNRSHSSIAILEKYFHTEFCDDTSDEDNCNVD